MGKPVQKSELKAEITLPTPILMGEVHEVKEIDEEKKI